VVQSVTVTIKDCFQESSQARNRVHEGYWTGEQEKKKGKSFFVDWTFILLWRVIIPQFIVLLFCSLLLLPWPI
jgi:hypothetical protein